MNDKSERNTKILAVVIVISVLFLGIYKLFFEKNKIIEEKLDTETISVLEDNSRFFTVSSCVSKYINYLSINDSENLLILLSNDYKQKNDVNSSNLYNYVGTINGTYSFIPKKMFQQRVSKSIYKYYVNGFIQKETIDSVSEKQEYYIVVILDEENMTFAIEPYDGSLFK